MNSKLPELHVKERMAEHPGPGERLLGLACYLGLAPLVHLRPSSFRTLFLRKHFAQSMAILFLFLSWFTVALLIDATEFLILIWLPDLDRWLGLSEFYLTCLLLLLFGAVAVLWMASVILAIAGSSRQVPLIQKLAGVSRINRVCVAANLVLLALIPITAGLAWHATSLTKRIDGGARVYFLYDQGIPVPRWSYALGLYRISLEARRNWGKGSVVLDRLNQENLGTALAHGKVVILATHGEEGYVYAFNAPFPRLGPGTFCVAPPDSGAVDAARSSRFVQTAELSASNNWSHREPIAVGADLRLVYLFACDAGKRAAQWEEHLGPAKVITYDRASTPYDHAWWFALTGPDLLKGIR